MTAFVSTAITGAAVANAAAIISQPALTPPDDGALVKIEEEIFEACEGAAAYDDDIRRASDIWTEEMRRLPEGMTPKERCDAVMALPACIEHNRLSMLQEPYYLRMDELIAKMFATPAHTAEGRRAKVAVLLGILLDDDWRGVDAETDRPELLARNLLIEFIGGEPGEMLRGQFV
jgi:hypothetical protein